MIYGSVCSGIEAATVAWHPLGWKPAWFSEIDKFPSAVLAHHYPEVPNLGDMTKFKEWDSNGINVLVGGTPCQSFSVAGLRKGLDDPRGNLMLTYLAIAAKYRPSWVVWENVPGVLSSNGGRDFGTFLTGLGELGYGFAYRILDAQHFGVPQRRRRVFVVGYIGDWRRAAAVLFERQSLSGNSAPSRKEREEPARVIACGVAPPLTRCAMKTAANEFNFDGGLVIHGTQDPCVSDNAFTLGRNSGQENVLAVSLRGRDGVATAELGGEVQNCLRASTGGGDKAHVMFRNQIRRLTPRECERLQGFPDDYTLIPLHNKKPSDVIRFSCDGPRYKALGNSMAVPVMRWIGERIAAVQALNGPIA